MKAYNSWPGMPNDAPPKRAPLQQHRSDPGSWLSPGGGNVENWESVFLGNNEMQNLSSEKMAEGKIDDLLLWDILTFGADGAFFGASAGGMEGLPAFDGKKPWRKRCSGRMFFESRNEGVS
jgi:hypothetical protein